MCNFAPCKGARLLTLDNAQASLSLFSLNRSLINPKKGARLLTLNHKMEKIIKNDMKQNNKIQKVLAAVLTITALMVGQQAWATIIGSGSENDPFVVDSWADLKAKMAVGGYIRLDADVTDPKETNNSYLVVPAGVSVTLDLNGHTIDRNMTEAQQGGYVILLNGQSNNHASLTIRDSQGGGQITGGFDGTGGGQSAAGGINVQYGDLTLEGGSICGNKCTFGGGGGVRVAGGTFTMTGGSITGNEVNTLKGAASAGGAIYGYIGDIYLRGGSITDNTTYSSSYACGGIAHDYANGAAQLHLSGTFTLSGNKKISYNTSTHDWTTVVGSDYLHGNRELIILDGDISPTAPIAIDLYSGYNARLTTNWNTHMGTADPDDYFTLVANSESDGKLLGVKDDDIYIGTPEEVYWHADADHDGSKNKPFIITMPEGLDLLATYVNGGNSPSNKYFQLGKDITYTHKDANEEGADTENNFTAIGNESNAFQGIFNGQNHVISGIRIYKPNDSYQGLFGYNGEGKVKNVIVSDAVITGKENVGGIVGANYGEIDNCIVRDAFITGNNYVGGISGSCGSFPIKGCLVDGTNVNVSGNGEGGAIVGYARNNSTLQNNYYHGCTRTIGSNTATTNIGVNNGDVKPNNGARAVFTITPASGVSFSGAAVTYNNVPYFAKDAKVTLSYNGEIAAGYNAIRYIVTSASGSTDISGYYLVNDFTFSMPAVDLLASVNTNDLALFLLDNDSNRPEGQKNADYIAIGGDRTKVFLQDRTLYKDGDWNTLCLPFSLDAAALAASPLAGATLMELDVTGIYDTDKQTGFDATTGTLYLFFKNATSITAGRPYIIKWAKANGYVNDKVHNVYSPVFPNVTIDNNASTEVSFTGGKFKGTYGKISFTEEDRSILLLGAQNKLFYPEAGANLNACRSYFQLNGLTVGDSNGVREFKLNFGEENEVSGITNTNFTNDTNEAGAWYDMQGRKVSKPTKAGVYIRGGRKVVIK